MCRCRASWPPPSAGQETTKNRHLHCVASSLSCLEYPCSRPQSCASSSPWSSVIATDCGWCGMRRDRRDGAENDEMMRNAECDVKPGLGLRRPATTCPRQPCSHPRPLEIFAGCAPCCAWALRIRCRRGTNPPIGLRRPSARPAPRHASPLFRLARLCGMQRIRLCVKRIVRSAEQRRNADATRCDEIGEALRNRDCAECYEIGEIVRNATRWRNTDCAEC